MPMRLQDTMKKRTREEGEKLTAICKILKKRELEQELFFFFFDKLEQELKYT